MSIDALGIATDDITELLSGPNRLPLSGFHLVRSEKGVDLLNNGVVVRSYNYEEPVVEAVFASFQDVDYIVIFLSSVIYSYPLKGGPAYVVNVNFRVKRAVRCSRGLIVERDMSVDSKYPHAYKLFSMFDPLADLGWVSPSVSSLDMSLVLLYVTGDSVNPLTVMYDPSIGRIHVYLSRYLSRRTVGSVNSQQQRRRRSSRRVSSRSNSTMQNSSGNSNASTSAKSTNSDSGGDDISSTLERKLSFTHAEMLRSVSAQGPESADILRKDITLLHLQSIECSSMGDLDSVKSWSFLDSYCQNLHPIHVFSLHMDGDILIVVVDKLAETVSIISPNEVDRSAVADDDQSSKQIVLLTAVDAMKFNDTEILLIIPNGSYHIFNPFSDLQSPRLTVGYSAKMNFVNSGSLPKYQFLVSSTGLLKDCRLLRVKIDPCDSLVQRCFQILGISMNSMTVDFLRYLWASARLASCKPSEWDSFVACSIAAFMDLQPTGTSEQKSEDNGVLAIARSLQSLANISQLDLEEVKPYFVLSLHVLREECKLHSLMKHHVLLLGTLLFPFVRNWPSWNKFYLQSELNADYDHSKVLFTCNPPQKGAPDLFRTLMSILSPPYVRFLDDEEYSLSQKIVNVIKFLKLAVNSSTSLEEILLSLSTIENIEYLPPGLLIYFKQCIQSLAVKLTKGGVPSVSESKLKEYSMLLNRHDVVAMVSAPIKVMENERKIYPKDLQTVLASITVESNSISSYDGPSEIDRVNIAKLIFNKDRRFYELTKLLSANRQQVAELPVRSGWTEAMMFRLQDEVYQSAINRMFSLSFGRGILYYSSRKPLSTERFRIPNLNYSVTLWPKNITMTQIKKWPTTQCVLWGEFHNGVAAGLSVSKDYKVTGSWISFNGEKDKANTSASHAGFLLGLGLNGHLTTLEEWHIFNYLGPKIPHASIALLIGLSASKIGTMDHKLTKVLSVHVAALLPVGSSDLYVSLEVQAAGLIGIGLLYCDTQHRQMSEVLFGQIGDSTKADECYHLCAGIGLGLINVGRGSFFDKAEKLVALATSLRDVQVSDSDKHVSGAICALIFIFMKTNNESVAEKIALPKSAELLEYMRPDFIIMRTLAEHIILWDSIECSRDWVEKHIPTYTAQFDEVTSLGTSELSLMSIIAGLCLAIGLRFAFSHNEEARDTILYYYDAITSLLEQGAQNKDESVTRQSFLNCQISMLLSVSVIMVGSGDLEVFRRCRRVYSMTLAETTFGSFMGCQMAMGILFVGGGQFALKNTPLAIASLIISFYPLFPREITDAMSYLLPLRHMWALALEPRCLVVRDVKTMIPRETSVEITLQSGAKLSKQAPCLLPPLQEIQSICTTDEQIFEVNIDFESRGPLHEALIEQKLNLVVQEVGDTFGTASNTQTMLSGSLKEQLTSSAEPSRWKYEFVRPSSATDCKLALYEIAKKPRSIEDMWNMRLMMKFPEVALLGSNREHSFLESNYIAEMKAELLKSLQ